jgi:hypothetical protein
MPFLIWTWVFTRVRPNKVRRCRFQVGAENAVDRQRRNKKVVYPTVCAAVFGVLAQVFFEL